MENSYVSQCQVQGEIKLTELESGFMIINRFLEGDLDNLMLFLDDNITENYEKGVFLTIMKRWPEGFLVMRKSDNIVGVAPAELSSLTLKLRGF